MFCLFVCVFVLLQMLHHLQQKDQTVIPAKAHALCGLGVFREQNFGILALGHIFQRKMTPGQHGTNYYHTCGEKCRFKGMVFKNSISFDKMFSEKRYKLK